MISLIIPTYNSSTFIRETIQSVKDQSYTDIELIVVDDGSTDDTVDLLLQIDFPLQIIRQKNMGRGSARNNGLKRAKGQYIAFLDHDDLLMPDSIAERVEYLSANPDIGWVFTDAMEFDHLGDLRLFLDQFPWLDLKQDHFCQLLRGCFPLTSTIMISSYLLREVGGFNISIDYGDDLELFLRLFLVSNVGMIRKPLTRRRIHPTQGVSSTFDRWYSRVGIFSNFKPSVGEPTARQRFALQEALKFSYFKLGECYWEQNDFKSARSTFLKSCGKGSYTLNALMYATMCMLPERLISTIRKAKHNKGGQNA